MSADVTMLGHDNALGGVHIVIDAIIFVVSDLFELGHGHGLGEQGVATTIEPIPLTCPTIVALIVIVVASMAAEMAMGTHITSNFGCILRLVEGVYFRLDVGVFAGGGVRGGGGGTTSNTIRAP